MYWPCRLRVPPGKLGGTRAGDGVRLLRVWLSGVRLLRVCLAAARRAADSRDLWLSGVRLLRVRTHLL